MTRYTFDASEKPLGRLASAIALRLMGKHEAAFRHEVKHPPQVAVTNSDRLVLTGRKWDKKIYYRHSGYLGHLKKMSAREVHQRDSRELIRRAVRGMLPKNKLRQQLMKSLFIYKGGAEAPDEKSAQ